jgi:hypothetical protein
MLARRNWARRRSISSMIQHHGHALHITEVTLQTADASHAPALRRRSVYRLLDDRPQQSFVDQLTDKVSVDAAGRWQGLLSSSACSLVNQTPVATDAFICRLPGWRAVEGQIEPSDGTRHALVAAQAQDHPAARKGRRVKASKGLAGVSLNGVGLRSGGLMFISTVPSA